LGTNGFTRNFVHHTGKNTQAAPKFSAASRGLGPPYIYLSQKSSQKHHSINLD